MCCWVFASFNSNQPNDDERFLAMIFGIAPVILLGQCFGVKAGVGLGNLYTIDHGQSGLLPEYESLISYSFTFNYWHKISDKVMIAPGLQLSSISTTYESQLNLKNPTGQKETLNLLYLRLPFTFNFMLNKFIPHIGPVFGYRTNEQVKNKQPGHRQLYGTKG